MADMVGWVVPEKIRLIKVADIDDPSAELNLESGSERGMLIVCYENVVGTDEFTIYSWDDSSSGAESVPFTIDGSAGIWIAVGGKFNNSSVIIPSTEWVYWGLPTVDGSWRRGIVNDDFVEERRESGTWIEKRATEH